MPHPSMNLAGPPQVHSPQNGSVTAGVSNAADTSTLSDWERAVEDSQVLAEDALCRPATELEQLEQMLDLTGEIEANEELQLDAAPEGEGVGTSPTAGATVGQEEPIPPLTPAVDPQCPPAEDEPVECCICFADLPSQQVCMLMKGAYGKKRSCRHYFHHSCVQLMMRTTVPPFFCPLCREIFVRAEPVPDVRLDGDAWFRAVDADDGGSLVKQEVIDALCATLPLDPEKLAASLEGDLWGQWDTEAIGVITREAFHNPSRGLLQYVLYSLPSLQRENPGGHAAAVPDLLNAREGWFRYWDENCEHALQFLQCLRAVARTLRLDGQLEDTGTLRSVLLELWLEFGLAEAEEASAASIDVEEPRVLHNHRPTRPLTQKLFCEKPDGFCDALIDALKKSFGPARFHRMRQRAQLLQQPAKELRKELQSLQVGSLDMIDKGEIVEAILDAKEANVATMANMASPTSQASKLNGISSQRAFPAAEDPLRPSQQQQPGYSADQGGAAETEAEEIRALPLSALQQRLRALGIPYSHCVERREVEDLLLAQLAARRARQPGTQSRTQTKCCSIQ